MKRITVLHRNGFEETFKTTEASLAVALDHFCQERTMWLEDYEVKDGEPSMTGGKFVYPDAILRIEIGRASD